ncbi:hypothetical protein GCM10009624_29720 [Gordonia sinesedis]
MSSRSRQILAIVAVAILFLTAASAVVDSSSGSGGSVYAAPREGTRTIATDDPATQPESIAVSRELFQSSRAAIVVASGGPTAADWPLIRATAATNHLPVFEVTPQNRPAIEDELRRLGVQTAYLAANPTELDGVEAVPLPTPLSPVPPRTESARSDRSDSADPAGPRGVALAQSNPAPTSSTPIVYVAPSTAPDAAATAAAAGARIVDVPIPDPRATGESVRVLRDNDGRSPVLAIGRDFGDDAALRNRAEAATTTPELVGGGQIAFPGRRMIALYGSPGVPALGPLGRQNLPATIDRAKRLAAEYRPVSRAPVIPAFEIIVTVASAAPGPDNQYSSIIDPAEIRPWVDAAERAGVYITLDLQPGRTDFLTQAKLYTDLLRRPNVGLALDPEWRLKPNQVHLTQIGSVSADEVNATSDWLARLVRDNNLPQKVFILHEFDANMLADRNRINTAHPELATVIHADGHGTPPVKMQTWRRITTDLPPRVFMGWKNFYTEDKPTFSPARTMAVKPTPWFISYQ